MGGREAEESVSRGCDGGKASPVTSGFEHGRIYEPQGTSSL